MKQYYSMHTIRSHQVVLELKIILGHKSAWNKRNVTSNYEMSNRKIQFSDEIILYSDDEDGEYLDSNENNRLIGSSDRCHHKIRRKEKKCCNPCPTLGIVLMCILVSLYIFLYNVYTSNSPSRVGTMKIEHSFLEHSSNLLFLSVSISGWDRNTTRDTATYVYPYVNTTLIEPVNVCNDKLFLLVIICSSAVNYETRFESYALQAKTSH